MNKELYPDDAVAWQQRFRAPVILWTQLACMMPTCGLVCTNRAGVYQLFASDVPSDTLTQLTDRPEGVRADYLAPDGQYGYYLDDDREH